MLDDVPLCGSPGPTGSQKLLPIEGTAAEYRIRVSRQVILHMDSHRSARILTDECGWISSPDTRVPGVELQDHIRARMLKSSACHP